MAKKIGTEGKKPGSQRSATVPPVVDQDEDGEDDGDFAELAARTVSRSDNTAAVARHLAEKAKARKQRDEWKAKYFALRDEVPDGAVVLVGDEAKAVEALQARNIDLTKLDTLVTKLESDNATLTSENLTFKSNEMFATYAETSGYNQKAIAGAVKGEKLHAELGDLTVDKIDHTGKKVGTETKKTLKVRPASDPKAPLVPFDDYITKNADYLWPALKAKDANTSTTTTPRVTTVEQGPSNTATTGGTDPVAAHRARRNAARAQQESPLKFGANTTMPAAGRRGVPTT